MTEYTFSVAMGRGDLAGMRGALEGGHDPNERGYCERTPLGSASNEQELRLLLEFGADLYARDVDGNSPVMLWRFTPGVYSQSLIDNRHLMQAMAKVCWERGEEADLESLLTYGTPYGEEFETLPSGQRQRRFSSWEGEINDTAIPWVAERTFVEPTDWCCSF